MTESTIRSTEELSVGFQWGSAPEIATACACALYWSDLQQIKIACGDQPPLLSITCHMSLNHSSLCSILVWSLAGMSAIVRIVLVGLSCASWLAGKEVFVL